MKNILPILATVGAVMTANAAPLDIVTVRSAYDSAETVLRLTNTAKAKSLTIFSIINFAQDASNAGLSMKDTRLIILGNPKSGTPVMQAVPLAALDLPLKILIWSDANDRVWVSYNAADYMKKRYGLTDELAAPISGIGALVEAALK